jgi:hypothetical protein
MRDGFELQNFNSSMQPENRSFIRTKIKVEERKKHGRYPSKLVTFPRHQDGWLLSVLLDI